MPGFSFTSQLPNQSNVTGTISSFTGTVSTLPIGIYLSSSQTPALVNMQGNPWLVDSRGNLRVAEQYVDGYVDNTNNTAWTNNFPLAVSTNAVLWADRVNPIGSFVVKASAGRLYRIIGQNRSIPAREIFVQVHNTTTGSGTGVPNICFAVAASGSFDYDLSPMGRYFSTGITVAVSLLSGSLTPAGGTPPEFGCLFSIAYM
jgi:hypothetical protein